MYSVALSGDRSMIAKTQGNGVVFSIAGANMEFASAISSRAAPCNKSRRAHAIDGYEDGHSSPPPASPSAKSAQSAVSAF